MNDYRVQQFVDWLRAEATSDPVTFVLMLLGAIAAVFILAWLPFKLTSR